MSENELLRWTVETTWKKIVPQNGILFVLAGLLLVILNLYLFGLLDRFEKYVFPLIGIIVFFEIINLITANMKTKVEYIITDKGVEKNVLYKQKVMNIMQKLAVNYTKLAGFLSSPVLSKSQQYVDFAAVSKYERRGDIIRLKYKIPGLDFNIITNNNAEQVISILEKYVG